MFAVALPTFNGNMYPVDTEGTPFKKACLTSSTSVKAESERTD